MEEVKRNYWYLGLSETFKDRFINATVMVRARNKKYLDKKLKDHIKD